MAKYVDAGYDDGGGAGGKKKKNKKGFKSDRRENFQRMMAKKMTGKESKKKESAPTRAKSVVFDPNALKKYVLTLHKEKNLRRVNAFVDVKRKMRKDHAKTRREQRETARLAYNRYAKIPILPNYTYSIPKVAEDEEEEEDDDRNSTASSSSHEGDGPEDMPWVYAGDGEDPLQSNEARAEAEAKRRKKDRRLATKAHTVHAMPASMMGEEEPHTSTGSSARRRRADEEEITVEVKPLFGAGAAAAATGRRASLPSADFSDLPEVVEQELRRLRQETKGPTKTKPRLHVMKELEKIRKIRKHSRKGHGKKTTSGKRKNRKS